jgi:hypothetical protein
MPTSRGPSSKALCQPANMHQQLRKTRMCSNILQCTHSLMRMSDQFKILANAQRFVAQQPRLLHSLSGNISGSTPWLHGVAYQQTMRIRPSLSASQQTKTVCMHSCKRLYLLAQGCLTALHSLHSLPHLRCMHSQPQTSPASNQQREGKDDSLFVT